MRNSVVAMRYAKALIKVVGDNKEEHERCLQALQNIPPLFQLKMSAKVLKSPVMPKSLKKELLKYAIGAADKDDVLNHFAYAMVDAGREQVIPEMVQQYANLLDEENGRAKAVLTTAVTFEESQVQPLKLFLEKSLGKSLRLDMRVKEEILGGLVLKIGNSLLDMSLKTKLDSLTSHQN